MLIHKCKEAHTIFTGKNALGYAIFFHNNGFHARNENDVFDIIRTVTFEECINWGIEPAKTSATFKDGVLGKGCHAKMYRLENSIILSSQNNGSSPLFEFAILYQNLSLTGKLSTYFSKVVAFAKVFSKRYKGKL